MAQVAPDHYEIASAGHKTSGLNATLRWARAHVDDFKIPVPVHAHVVPPVLGQEDHIEGARDVEPPFVDSRRVDLVFDETEYIFEGLRGKGGAVRGSG